MVTAMTFAVAIVIVAVTPAAAVTAPTPAPSSVPAVPAVPAAPVILRHCRQIEAGLQRRIRRGRDPRHHRLVAFHRAELHFGRCSASLVREGGPRGDRSTGDV